MWFIIVGILLFGALVFYFYAETRNSGSNPPSSGESCALHFQKEHQGNGSALSFLRPDGTVVTTFVRIEAREEDDGGESQRQSQPSVGSVCTDNNTTSRHDICTRPNPPSRISPQGNHGPNDDNNGSRPLVPLSPLSCLYHNNNHHHHSVISNHQRTQQTEQNNSFDGCELTITPNPVSNSILDLPLIQSALSSQREEQLRELKLEINELSRRLGIGRVYGDHSIHRVHRGGGGRRRSVPPQADFDNSTRNEEEDDDEVPNNTHPRFLTDTSPSFMSESRGPSAPCNNNLLHHPSPSSMGRGHTSGSTSMSSSSSSSSTSLNDGNFLQNQGRSNAHHHHGSTTIAIDGGDISLFPSSSFEQTFTLGVDDRGESSREVMSCYNNEIDHQRQRRLRLIRMEIEDLTFQLSSLSEDRCASGDGASISSSVEGLALDPVSSSSCYENYIPRRASTANFYDLPSYDEIQAVVVEGSGRCFESPPPSYTECTKFLTSSSCENTKDVEVVFAQCVTGSNKEESGSHQNDSSNSNLNVISNGLNFTQLHENK